MKGKLWHSAVASQPCPSGHIIADKRLRYALPKLPSATSFICKTIKIKDYGEDVRNVGLMIQYQNIGQKKEEKKC